MLLTEPAAFSLIQYPSPCLQANLTVSIRSSIPVDVTLTFFFISAKSLILGIGCSRLSAGKSTRLIQIVKLRLNRFCQAFYQITGNIDDIFSRGGIFQPKNALNQVFKEVIS
jgi:hypothetical protein